MSNPTPISRLPINQKMEACIKEGKSFNNLGSTLCTALRWEGDFWILSTAVWRDNGESYGQVAVDIAVGRKGERPFLIRPPYCDDPRKKFLWEPTYQYRDGRYFKTVMKKKDVDVQDDLYARFIDRTMQRRLDALMCYTYMKKYATDTVINPKTGRKNKIRKNVYWLICHGCPRGKDLNIDATPISWETDYHAYGDIDPWVNRPRYHKEPNPIYKRFEVPLVKYGWYFSTTGQLAFESDNPKFIVPENFI